METFSLIVEILVIGLVIALFVTIFKYPKDIIRGFLNFIEPELFRPITWIMSPVWFIAYGLDKTFKWGVTDQIKKDKPVK